MKHLFHLRLTYQECMQYYQGHYTGVQVTTVQGLSLQFPAEHIRAFVTTSGINGKFELTTDQNNKFVSLIKLA